MTLQHLGPRPDGSGSWSPRETQKVLERMAAAVDMEQDVTLTADECWVLLKSLQRAAHQSRRRDYAPPIDHTED